MGQKVSDTVDVRASIETIVSVVTDLERYPEWAEGVKSAEVLERDAEGRPSRGRFEVDAKVVEVTYTIDYRYTDTSISWTLVEGDPLSQLDGAYEMSDNGGTTRLTYVLEADVSIPLPNFVKKRAAKQILDQGLRGLKAEAEARA